MKFLKELYEFKEDNNFFILELKPCIVLNPDYENKTRKLIASFKEQTKIYNLADPDKGTGERKNNVAFARQTLIHFIKEHTCFSLKKVGSYFGDRDHTTILHSVARIDDIIETKSYEYAKLMNYYKICEIIWNEEGENRL